MGVWESIVAILSGKGKQTVPVQLAPGEVELYRTTSNYRQVGGDLVITNQRVVFTPLETADVITVLTWGLKATGAPGPAAKIPGALGDLARSAEVGAVAAVAPGTNGNLIQPPTLVITGADGIRAEFSVLAGRRKASADPANVAARDEAVERIRQALVTPPP